MRLDVVWIGREGDRAEVRVIDDEVDPGMAGICPNRCGGVHHEIL
ncbi:hypothetical protein [Prosthecodimorpha staleyi]|nr:hypothetical protein [Prosthecodimorpha staleyi]